jgi:hypothetical protein
MHYIMCLRVLGVSPVANIGTDFTGIMSSCHLAVSSTATRECGL